MGILDLSLKAVAFGTFIAVVTVVTGVTVVTDVADVADVTLIARPMFISKPALITSTETFFAFEARTRAGQQMMDESDLR